MKNILITGGAGFIGSNLCEELVKKEDFRVTSLDNYSTGSSENHIQGVNYIAGDTSQIEKLVDFKPDIVYHLGEYSRVEQSFFEVEKVWNYNKLGTFSVLEFCRKNKCKIVYAGSSTKFGDGGLGRSQSPYGWTKASNTELVVNYGEWFGLDYAICYFYNAFGKREISKGKYATLIALFAEKMRKGENLTVVSPGNQRRNFTNVKDIISALVLIGEKGHGDEYGIGNSESFSVLEIAKIFGGNIDMIPPRKGNRFDSSVISEKTLSLGWKPKYSVVEYIKDLKQKNWSA